MHKENNIKPEQQTEQSGDNKMSVKFLHFKATKKISIVLDTNLLVVNNYYHIVNKTKAMENLQVPKNSDRRSDVFLELFQKKFLEVRI